jgi:outer membrane protein OmpA-like peptidoglycan-associated protein
VEAAAPIVVEDPVAEAAAPIVVEVPVVRLDPEDEQKLQRLATMLSANRAILRVRVEIHLDGTGDPMSRGEALVVAARSLLTFNGITPDRVEIVNRGATVPLVTPEVTDQDRAKNRRVDVIVVQVGSR